MVQGAGKVKGGTVPWREGGYEVPGVTEVGYSEKEMREGTVVCARREGGSSDGLGPKAIRGANGGRERGC